jgi:hypothetical protein
MAGAISRPWKSTKRLGCAADDGEGAADEGDGTRYGDTLVGDATGDGSALDDGTVVGEVGTTSVRLPRLGSGSSCTGSRLT